MNLGMYRENLERVHRFVRTVSRDGNPYTEEALRSLNWMILQTDRNLTPKTLEAEYSPEGGGEHPVFTRGSWRDEVAADNTLCGYWDWVINRIAEALEEELSW